MTPRALPKPAEIVRRTPRKVKATHEDFWRRLPLYVIIPLGLAWALSLVVGYKIPDWAVVGWLVVFWGTTVVSSTKSESETVAGLEHRIRELELTVRKLERHAWPGRD